MPRTALYANTYGDLPATLHTPVPEPVSADDLGLDPGFYAGRFHSLDDVLKAYSLFSRLQPFEACDLNKDDQVLLAWHSEEADGPLLILFIRDSALWAQVHQASDRPLGPWAPQLVLWFHPAYGPFDAPGYQSPERLKFLEATGQRASSKVMPFAVAKRFEAIMYALYLLREGRLRKEHLPALTSAL